MSLEKTLWPMLLEKAYAQYKEGYGETGQGEGGYDLIGKGGFPGDAVKLLSDVKSLKRNRIAYWDDRTGTVVIYDPGDQAENGTAFIHENGKYYFTDEIE